MRFSSVDALFEAPPRRSLSSNLSQLGIGRRANKKPRPIIAGQGCVGSDTKLLCMRFCCRTGSTPRHPDRLCCKDDRRRWEDGDKLDPISFMRRYRKER
jgi:hypothetical protein